ncbi:MAG TPA: hypothetical protein VFD27_16790 [Chthoniobacteraceae bacterium]|jgi:hypothetical protein|nr:hypothetical protein [Chthoniobacteraceae bacterium]
MPVSVWNRSSSPWRSRLPAGDRVEVRSAKPLHIKLSAPPDPLAFQDGPAKEG